MVGTTGYRDRASLFGLQRLDRFLDAALAGMPTPEEGSVITSREEASTRQSPGDPGQASAGSSKQNGGA
jgi:hypothetical protein